jgi:hypothetical protein
VYTRLAKACKRLEADPHFGPAEHQTLVAIGELLRIAAETFSAFRTGKKLERDARSLREQALAMAGSLPPALEDEHTDLRAHLRHALGPSKEAA